MVSTTGAICHMLEHRNTCAFTLTFFSITGKTTAEIFSFYFFHIRVPHKGYTLQYVEVIHRHHKRTPYSSNMFFKEDIEWSCVGEGPVYAVTR